MDLVGLCHFEGLISLVSFPQPPRRREYGSSYACDSMRTLDSSGWLWPAMVVGQKKRLVTLHIIHRLDIHLDEVLYFVHMLICVICSISFEIAPRIGFDVGAVWRGACM